MFKKFSNLLIRKNIFIFFIFYENFCKFDRFHDIKQIKRRRNVYTRDIFFLTKQIELLSRI